MNKWTWNSTTQIIFGEKCISEHLAEYIKSNSKVLVTFGGGSIEKNGCKSDVIKVLESLNCETKWEGGIPANPEYDRLLEIIHFARSFKPDYLLAIGGGSVIDGTKFVLSSIDLNPNLDPWETVIVKKNYAKTGPKLITVLTLAATGSEWNNGFVISRRSTKQKLSGYTNLCLPLASFLDPCYTMTLPQRQIANGLYDSMCHCIDMSMTGEHIPMFDRCWYSVMRELVDITPSLMKKVPEKVSLEAHGRLMVAASFALNHIFELGRTPCDGIHGIGHQLTAMYGIDHAATLSIVTPFFHEALFEERKSALAEAAEYVFDVREGSVDERGRAFIERIRQWIRELGLPQRVSEWSGAKIESGDLERVTQMVMASRNFKPFGYKGQVTEAVVRNVLEHSIQ